MIWWMADLLHCSGGEGVVGDGSGRGSLPDLAEVLVGGDGLLVCRSWRRWSPLVLGHLLAWQEVPLVMLIVGPVQVMVLLIPLNWVLQVLSGHAACRLRCCR